MNTLSFALNPFIMMIDSKQVLDTVVNSDALRNLRSKRLKPLDNKNTLLQQKIKPAARNANNYGLPKTISKEAVYHRGQ